jgi:hypothetical protein
MGIEGDQISEGLHEGDKTWLAVRQDFPVVLF